MSQNCKENTLVGMEVEKPFGSSGRELPPREYHSPSKYNPQENGDIRELIKRWGTRIDQLEKKIERLEKILSRSGEKI